MIYKLKELDSKMIEYIFKSYDQGMSLSDISTELKIAKNTLLSLYYKYNKYYYREECTSFSLNTDKVLTIADSHVGSIYENESYIYEAFNIAFKKNIKVCLHLGDMIQGVIGVDDRLIDYQLDKIDKWFPKDDEIGIYLVLGNHEWIAIEKYPYVLQFLESRFRVMGYKYVYFEWNGYLFAMEHHIKQFSDPMVSEEVAQIIMGHGHELKIKSETKLKAPPLCDQIMSDKRAFSGFMINEFSDQIFDSEVYSFENNKARVRYNNYATKEINDIYKLIWN